MSVSVLQLRYELNSRVVAKDHSTTFDIWDANERRASLSPGKGEKKKRALRWEQSFKGPNLELDRSADVTSSSVCQETGILETHILSEGKNGTI